MTQPAASATPYNPLLTYQFRLQLLDLPADPSPEQLGRSTLGADPAPPSTSPPDVGGATAYVAGVRRVSGLTLTVAASETWEGGNSLHRYANPHRAVWDPITLEQGIALDTQLQSWAEAGIAFLRTGTVKEPVKRNVLLDVWDPGITSADRPRARYLIFNAWVSKYQALPRLDAMADEVALLSVELTHHGWRRDPPPDLFDTPQ
jgi:phage tail-like protein